MERLKFISQQSSPAAGLRGSH